MHVFIYLGVVLYVHFSHLFKSCNCVLRVCKPLSFELRHVTVELLKCFFPFQVSIVRLEAWIWSVVGGTLSVLFQDLRVSLRHISIFDAEYSDVQNLIWGCLLHLPKRLLHCQGTCTQLDRENALWGYIFGLNQYAVDITMITYVC